MFYQQPTKKNNRNTPKKLNSLHLHQKKSYIYDSQELEYPKNPVRNYSERKVVDEYSVFSNDLDFIYRRKNLDVEPLISNIEYYSVSLLRKTAEKKEYVVMDNDEHVEYKLTPQQLHLANKIRRHTDNFRRNASNITIDMTKNISKP